MKKTKITIEAVLTDGKIDIEVTAQKAHKAAIMFTCHSLTKGILIESREKMEGKLGDVIKALGGDDTIFERTQKSAYEETMKEMADKYDEVNVQIKPVRD